MLPVKLRRAARHEYLTAGDWYEQQRPGLGLLFSEAIQEVFDRIAIQPQRYRLVLRDIRKAVVPAFPYCVYFRLRDNEVVVLSVFHTSRDPSIWQTRS